LNEGVGAVLEQRGGCRGYGGFPGGCWWLGVAEGHGGGGKLGRGCCPVFPAHAVERK